MDIKSNNRPSRVASEANELLLQPALLAEALTARETEVLWWLAHGATYERIAERLGMSPHTVTTHIKNLYRKLDVHSAARAVMRAVELNLIGSRGDKR